MNADIIAMPITNAGLAGLALGDGVELLEPLGTPLARRPLRDHPLGEVVDYGEVLVLLIRGKVDRLIAMPGYLGEAPFGLKVGMVWDEVQRRQVPLTYDDESMFWRLAGHESLFIEVHEPANLVASSSGVVQVVDSWVEARDYVTDARSFVAAISVMK